MTAIILLLAAFVTAQIFQFYLQTIWLDRKIKIRYEQNEGLQIITAVSCHVLVSGINLIS